MNTTNRVDCKNHNLREYLPELITTLLYASAISAMLSFIISVEKESNILMIFNTFLIILLVFADWNNRILIPSYFPPEDKTVKKSKPLIQYSKLAFEIFSMVFLIMFFRYLIKGDHVTVKIINIYTIFTFYLFSCGIWNIIIIKIMSGIKFKSLLISIFKGNVFDMEGLSKYIGDFVKNIKKERDMCRETLITGIENTEKINTHVNSYQNSMNRSILKMNIVRTFAQFIGNHILWANFIVGLILILHSYNITISINYQINVLFHFSLSLGIIILLAFVLLILIWKIDLEERKNKALFGLTLLLLLLIIYTNINIDFLIYFIIFQQILIGILVECFTRKIQENE